MPKSPSINNTLSQYRNKFYSVYHTKIAPIFKSFEKKRRAKLSELIVIEIITVGILTFLIYDFIQRSRNCDSGGAIITVEIICIIAGIILGIWLQYSYNSKFASELKHACMFDILKLFGDVHWHDKANLITDEEMDRSFLFAPYNTREACDAFNGNFKGVDFKICETHLQRITGSGKNRRVVEVFKGVVVNFKANKTIKNTTIIASKGDYQTKVGSKFAVLGILGYIAYYMLEDFLKHGFNITGLIIWLGIALCVIIGYFAVKLFTGKNQESLQEIKLEDPEFTKKYQAFSSDQIEGRYLITPAFMERFQNLQTSFGARKAKCSFYGDNLMFAIFTNKNLFEIGNLFHSLEDPKQMEVFFNELTSIFLLVDYFKLDEKTGI